MTPLYQLGAFGYPVAMALATVLGIGFGFVLERAGFGRAGVLVSQFYGDDMRVLKVMFSAVVTTMVGLGIFSELGVIDLALIQIPETFILPAIVGGLILGVGFVVSGYCPGTAMVAIGSGHLDGLVALVGIMLGSLIFGFAYDPLEALYLSTAHGRLTFVEVLGVAWPLLALGVTVMAILAFLAGERAERYFAPKHGLEAPRDDLRVRNGLFVGFAAAALLGALTLALPEPEIAAAEPPPVVTVDAVTVAEHLARGHQDLYLVDLRAPEVCAAARIPGALCLPEDDGDARFVADLIPTRTLVLYGVDELDALPVSTARYGNDVRVLAGGWNAWQRTILSAPVVPSAPTPEDVARYQHLAGLHAYFTGAQAPAAPIQARPTAVVRQSTRRGGGC